MPILKGISWSLFLLLLFPATADALDLDAALAKRVLGDPDAPITVVIYESLTCTHCAAFHAHTYEAVKARYVDSGKVKLVVQQYLRNGADLRASMMTRCVPESDFFDVVEVLFEHQDDWASNADPVKGLKRIGKKVGLRGRPFEACMANEALLDGLIKEHREMSRDGVTGTPSFLIDGELHVGDRSIEEFAQLLDPLLVQD